ncbi:DEAD/DEAH box helicase [Lentilactobacillus otakiensis]|uniref:DEAD/DEAH boxhelicase n=1 Tax=Lentilactobacillus otakiensis DSM 19908 = JCM 15040 TaxID=1423780 RepID=S4NS17_9LACO|nr:DEAD/DEAH box helicase [Lentilactobacillus otakiensis]KRL09687.1 DEAD DEAH box helicase [Lentilactobacillus otakiensis DSM 19908 = JCM 15040]MBZ3777776.1 DEAD/DEAH box helicase [Lentilactobacillus otakiensis]MDV3518341.1 DEAD/DEAH box helicase [Lentilactobacillus otakiensis]GAD16728.1 DEAD/DEAH boxhelicase [Lentilactobacillus otakiensis DSM 19908 = JCM 15040]
MIEEFKQHATKLGYQKPTAIQKAVYQPLKDGKSVLGLAPTGSGKTVAFALPLLENIQPEDGLSLLVIEPSAELAMQTQKVLLEWGQLIGLSVQGIIGGANINRQVDKLKERPNVIVGTTGRIMNLIDLGKLKLDSLHAIVIDEADNLLSEDTLASIRSLVDLAPDTTSLGFFSATKNDLLEHINRWFVQDIQTYDVSDIDDTRGEVKHTLLEVSNRKKEQMLLRFLHMKDFKALVFFDQMDTLQKVAGFLSHRHIKEAAQLTSEQRQTARQKALRDFRDGKIRLLLTTDVAARGMDIDKLPAVVNFDLPSDPKTYIHRVGRTGRMHQDGLVINMGDDHDLRDLKKLVKPYGYQPKNIYFDGNQLSDTRPTEPVNLEDEQPSESKSQKKAENKQDRKKPTSRPNPPKPKGKKKHKHSKRKGMHHKRTEG